MMELRPATGCRHCTRPKRLEAAQLDAMLREVLQQHAWTEAPADTARARLQLCAACAHYDRQDTCRVCGCSAEHSHTHP